MGEGYKHHFQNQQFDVSLLENLGKKVYFRNFFLNKYLKNGLFLYNFARAKAHATNKLGGTRIVADFEKKTNKKLRAGLWPLVYLNEITFFSFFFRLFLE